MSFRISRGKFVFEMTLKTKLMKCRHFVTGCLLISSLQVWRAILNHTSTFSTSFNGALLFTVSGVLQLRPSVEDHHARRVYPHDQRHHHGHGQGSGSRQLLSAGGHHRHGQPESPRHRRDAALLQGTLPPVVNPNPKQNIGSTVKTKGGNL